MLTRHMMQAMTRARISYYLALSMSGEAGRRPRHGSHGLKHYVLMNIWYVLFGYKHDVAHDVYSVHVSSRKYITVHK